MPVRAPARSAKHPLCEPRTEAAKLDAATIANLKELTYGE